MPQRVPQEPPQAVCASNRCPACAYPLDGLPGVPQEPYGPFTRGVACPECGLDIPMGARCLVGASMLYAVGRGRMAFMRHAPLVVIGALVVAEAGWLGYRLMRGGTLANGTVILSMAVVATLAVVMVVLWRRNAGGHDSDTDATHGGSDARFMFEPGALRVFTGPRHAPPEACAAADVQRVSANSETSPGWRPLAQPIMAMRILVPVHMRARNAIIGGVIAFFVVPPGQRPAEIARACSDTLRARPAPGAVLPPTRTQATPSVPPVCPRCGRGLAASAAAEGLWSEPLAGPVTCGACTFHAPAGAYVLSGWKSVTGSLTRARRAQRMAIVVVAIGVIGAFGVMYFFMARSSPVAMFSLQIVTMALAMGVPLLMARLQRGDKAARPAGRFQPGGVAWVVEPGVLTIIERPGRMRRVERRVPAAGISQLAFASLDDMTGATPNADALYARGVADQLGLLGERSITLSWHAGVDRDALVQALMHTLKAPNAARAGRV